MLNCKIISSIILSFCLITFFGCGEDKCEDIPCFNCNETITWTSYGKASLGNFGSDNTAYCLESKCGWHIKRNPQGYTYVPIRVSSCNEAVTLCWSYNTFSFFMSLKGGMAQPQRE